MLEITNPYTHAVIVNHDGSNSPKEVYGVKVVNIYNIESVNTMWYILDDTLPDEWLGVIYLWINGCGLDNKSVH